MFSDGILPLCESGVINNAEKGIDKGKLVASFIMGNKKLYDFIDDNPLLIMRDVAYTNNPEIIAQNPKVIALNAAIEVDLTGQINAESIGTSQFSGCGGQLDFVRGANASKGGKSIIAMPATTNKGVSKIVPTLSPGATVTTPRQDIHYVITEFGIADLYGKTLQKRAKELIKIANPMHQEELEKAAFDRFGKHFIYCK
jgi:acyl-CoA hydrolase